MGNAGLICTDSRIKTPPAGTTPIDCGEGAVCYVRSFQGSVNFIATNPIDYDAGEEWISRQCFGPKK